MFLQEHLDSDCSSPSRCFSTAAEHAGLSLYCAQVFIGVFLQEHSSLLGSIRASGGSGRPDEDTLE